MPEQKWPRRGTHWDVFGVDGELEIERMDEPPEGTSEDEWDNAPAWPDGPRFEHDDEAAGYVLATASRPPEDAPEGVVAECRAAVREIVRSWKREEREGVC